MAGTAGLSVALVRVGWAAAWSAGFRVQGSGFKVKNFELWVKCSGLGLRTYI